MSFFLLAFSLTLAGVRGASIPITQAPYLVTIDLDNQAVFDGALVAPGWVLVAGTSITWLTDDDWTNHITVRAGSARRSMGGQSLKTKNHTWHEKFDKLQYDYNVALLQLDGQFSVSDSIAPIKLATVQAAAGSQVNVTLFGSLPDDHATESDLQQFNVSIIARTACRIAYQDYMDDITDRIICGGMPMPPGGVCYGESGNPIIQNGALAGIFATALGCWNDKPALYTNLAHPEIASFVTSTIGSAN